MSMTIGEDNKFLIFKLRNSKYDMTRRVRERLTEIDKRFQQAIGVSRYAEEYHKHLEFLTTPQSKEQLSFLENKYFTELLTEVSTLTEYNLQRSHISSTYEVMQAVMLHLKRRERKMEMSLFGENGVFFTCKCSVYLTDVLSDETDD